MPKKESPLTFCLICETSLGLVCAKKILHSGHKISAVVSQRKTVVKWAKATEIPILSNLPELQQQYKEKSFNYILSIVNNSLLTNDTLKLAERTINFHDAPLPKYAGINSAAWAIFNGEKEHGVTWHFVNSKIDAGDILVQETIPIEKNDTAQTLHLKCYKLAAETFDVLLQKISRNQLHSLKQDLNKRTYYGRHKKPATCGIINFQLSSHELWQQAKSFLYCDYQNTFCSLKVMIGSHFFSCSAIPVSSILETKVAPGRITLVEENSLQVSTSDGDLKLSNFKTLDNRQLNLENLLATNNLSLGKKLRIVTKDDLSELHSFYEEESKNEGFWINELSTAKQISSTNVSNQEKNKETLTEDCWKIDPDISRSLLALLKETEAEDLHFKLFALFIWKLYDSPLTFGFPYYRKDTAPNFKGLFSELLPLNLPKNPPMCLKKGYQDISEALNTLKGSGTFISDLLTRYPNLSPPVSHSMILNIAKEETVSIKKHGLLIANFKKNHITLMCSNKSLHPHFNWKKFHVFLKEIETALVNLDQKQSKEDAPLPTKEAIYPNALWNNTQINHNSPLLLHQYFEKQARKHPDRIAIVFKDKHLSYHYLNQQADALAYSLKEQGVESESFVGVLMDRSVELVISLLAIFKAGSVYMPFESSTPLERIKRAISQLNCKFLLTNSQFPRLTEKTIFLDKVNWSGNDAFSLFHPIEKNLSALAYIIHTSGSTGTPKAAGNTHTGIENRLLWMKKQYTIDQATIILHKTPISFDVSLWELLLPLICGSKLILAPPQAEKDPEKLCALMKKNHVTLCHFVPSLLSIFQRDSLLQKCTSLRHVICSGESLSTKNVEIFHQQSTAKLHNLYGPTEASIDVSHWTTHPPNQSQCSVPIGRPISNTKIYILNKNLEQIPISSIGEIYITGDGLARGYINQPDLTADKFIANPFATQEDICTSQNLRLYKTGDLGKYLENGNIDFCGRADQQIKIRGYRVELEEIEYNLLSSPLVCDAVVIARKESKELVAYISIEKKILKSLNTPLNASDSTLLIDPALNEISQTLREYLREKLPDYMIPHHIVFLENFPLTSSGKINRKELPAPNNTNRSINQNYAPPRNKIEKDLVLIWQEILNIHPIGIYDNFISAGGDSISSIQISSKAKTKNFHFSPRLVLEHQNIAELSQYVTQKETTHTQKATTFRKKNYALTPLQSGLLFRELYNKSISGEYIVQTVIELQGKINLEIIQIAWQEVIQAHDILRMAFVWENMGIPLQYTLDGVLFSCKSEDWSKYSKETIESKLTSFLEKDRKAPFDLSAPPLFRLSLMTLPNETFYLMWSYHHIILDGWSSRLILNDFFHVYCALIKNKKAPLKTYSYKTYLQCHEKQRKDKALDFWTKNLHCIEEPSLLVPPQKNSKELHQKRLRSSFSQNFWREVKRYSQSNNYTINTLIQASIGLVLSQLISKKTLSYGITISGRSVDLENIDHIPGLLINTLPLSIEIKKYHCIKEYLDSLQKQTLSINEHSFVSLAEIQKIALPNGDPLFDTILVFENYPSSSHSETKKGELSVKSIDSHEQNEFPLTFVFFPGKTPCLELSYKSPLFTQKEIERIAELFRETLKNLIQLHPSSLLQKISSCPKQEKETLLTKWNHYVPLVEKNFLLPHELFEQQARSLPHRIALICKKQHITYYELNQRANRLASHLRKQGIGPEVCVAVSLERDIDLVTTILSILKTGGTYLPLDFSLPEKRLNFMIKDSGAHHLITQNFSSKKISTSAGKHIDLQSIDLSNAPECNLKSEINSHHKALAYTIYTSGSTGQPKGVGLTYKNLSSLLCSDKLKILDVTKNTRSIWVSSLLFDASIWELFAALSSGGTLVIPQNSQNLVADELLDSLKKEQISYLPIPASLLSSIPLDFSNQIKTAVVFGDVPNRSALEKWSGKSKIFNGYGPTENTIASTLFLCTSPLSSPLPIGTPISNSNIYVLDEALHPTPMGIIGEIYIAGDGLARGYINQPALTAEKFIANPFATKENAKQLQNLRLYKTGDLGKYNPDGNIVFCNRVDHQVKIRGYRVELREIEHKISSSHLVQNSVVLVDKTAKNNKLVAYIELTAEALKNLEFPSSSSSILSGSKIDQLKDVFSSDLKNSLPSYMIPSIFVFLENFPLTSNGKINRKALSIPNTSTPSSESAYASPCNGTEKKLCLIWQEVLGLEKIGVHDNFFALGGDSISSIQISSKAKQIGLSITVRELFQSPTISQLAKGGKLGASEQVNFIDREEIPFPVTPIQKRFFEEKSNMLHTYTQDIVFCSKKPLTISSIKKILEELQKKHRVFSLRYTCSSKKIPHWTQYYTKKQNILLQEFDLSSAPTETVEEKISEIRQNAKALINIIDGPLFVLCHLKKNGKSDLLLIAHHLIIDAVSWKILLEDFECAYRLISENNSYNFMNKTHSFQYWQKSLESYEKNITIKEKDYWKSLEEKMVICKPEKDLKTGYVTEKLTTSTTIKLLRESHKKYNTSINDLLLTALSCSLSKWGKATSMVVELEGHGREEVEKGIDLSHTIGWFTSLYPFDVKTNQFDSLENKLLIIKKRREKIPLNGAGYGIYRLGISTPQPQSQILFNYLGQWTKQDQNSHRIFHFSKSDDIAMLYNSHQVAFRHKIIINAVSIENQFHVHIAYNPDTYAKHDIKKLERLFLDNVEKIIEHCCKHTVLKKTNSISNKNRKNAIAQILKKG